MNNDSGYMQFHAGYLIEGIWKSLFKSLTVPEQESKIRALLRSLSCFEVASEVLDAKTPVSEDSILKAASNAVSRGLPTRPSLHVEELFSSAFGLTVKEEDATGGLAYGVPGLDEQMIRYLNRSLHIVDHRLCPTTREMGLPVDAELESDLERDFFYKQVPALTEEFIPQLMHPQRLFTSILDDPKFIRQRVDFSIEFPYEVNKLRGFILEVDGQHHRKETQLRLDDQRVNVLKEKGWKTLRIPSDAWQSIKGFLAPLSGMLDETFFQILKKNIEEPLPTSEKSLDALQLALSPFGIARVQKTLLELILHGVLDLSADSWHIAVVERDVPCAVIALQDLQELLEHFFFLEGKDRKVPNLEIDLFVTEEYRDAKLHDAGSVTPRLLGNHDPEKRYDIMIDVSVLQRPGFSSLPANIDTRHAVEIRSAHAELDVRCFHTDSVIQYREVAFLGDTEEWNIHEDVGQVLQYFLRNWFRKKNFREGQLEILNRALQGKSVIGLLPTGGGKSLTYQLASLLQPGITLVIDPLISLMKDQVDGLTRNWIDACSFVNSTLTTQERKEAIRRFSNAEVLYAFVSPERMQMEEFRSSLMAMYENAVYFSYFVIDETHCVSEWGHDFRYSYLRLGRNARRFCLTKNKMLLPIFGLTATASYDVLSEVQRELSDSIDGFTLPEEAVIRHDTVNRKELHFRVIEVSIPDQQYPDDWAIKKELGEQKKGALLKDLMRLPKVFEEINNRVVEGDGAPGIPGYDTAQFVDGTHAFAGIIFCPHRSWHFGVTGRYQRNANADGVADALENAQKFPLRLGIFMGGGDSNGQSGHTLQQRFLANQEAFINNEFHLMVATKAFGMGIDKPNVRYTYHLNYPQSLESYVQEAGRAGRDSKLAVCNILFNDQTFDIKGHPYNVDVDILEYFHSNSFKGAEKEIWVLEDLFREISFGNRTNAQLIAQGLDVELDSEIQLGYWQGGSKRRLYLNYGEGESVGYIDLNSWDVYPDKGFGRFKLALEILEGIASKVKSEAEVSELSVKGWLEKTSTITSEPGLQGHLDAMRIGETRQIDIGFNNDHETHRNKLDEILNTAVFTAMSTKDFSNIPFHWDAIVEQLHRKYNTQLHKLEVRKKSAFKEHLFRVRYKSDTEKALYRLSLMGLVEDYTVDFNSNTFRVTLKKREDEEYVSVVRSYVRLHYSEVKTNGIMEEFLQNRKGKGIVKDCLRFLIDFVYQEVADRRKEGIRVMRDACRIGAGKNGSAEFKEYLDLYFNSIYARRKFLPTDTKDGDREDIDIVWRYMEIVSIGAQVNNLKHLRGACMRLLSLYARRNPVFLLLKAFAQLVLEPANENLVRDSRQLLNEGFRHYQLTGLLDGKQYLAAVRKYQNRIAAFTDDQRVHKLLDTLVEELITDYHLTWVKEFNRRMLTYA